MAGRFVSVPMALSDLERPDVRNQFLADLNNAGYWLGQQRYCIYTNACRGLSAAAEFLVFKMEGPAGRIFRTVQILLPY